MNPVDQKNLVLSNYSLNEINDLPADSEKIKHIINYLEDVNTLLKNYNETINSLIASNDSILETLNFHQGHLSSHDQHLESHDQQLALNKKE